MAHESLTERQNDIYCNCVAVCAPLAVHWQAQCSCFIILLLISAKKLELWIPPTTEVVFMKFWMQQEPELQATMF